LEKHIPLCVDLDGTLVKSDTLFEQLVRTIKINPLSILFIFFWILRGKLYFKEKLNKITAIKAELLPYNNEVIEFIKDERNNGRKVYLATASHKYIAEKVADHLRIFDGVFASDNGTNLKGKTKRDLLVNRFGEHSFDYIGNSRSDIPIWKSTNSAHIVSADNTLIKSVKNQCNIGKVFQSSAPSISTIFKELRIYQWVKNILIFLPFLLAHKIPTIDLTLTLIIAFLSFGFTASSVYILNDLMDLEADRVHPRKRFRPFASGELQISFGLILAPLLLLVAFSISVLFLSSKFTIVLLAYLIITNFYSLYFKRIYILDILTLAGLYSIRLLSGALAADVQISPWLITFSMFIFLSLAVVKRYTELIVARDLNRNHLKGRDYSLDDMDLLRSLGISSGYISVLIFALYINSREISQLYNHPQFLWGCVPLLLYWVTRIWFLAHRGKMQDDPIVFTVRDRASYLVGILIVLLALGAMI
jgi:4-hydroxybenzoate polyprenyltransferase